MTRASRIAWTGAAALAVAALAALALLAACGKGDRDVVLGEAILVNLKKYQRVRWRELWLSREGFGMVKLPIIVPAGQTLMSRPDFLEALLLVRMG